MILNQNTSSTVEIGQVQEHKIGIDPKNIEHIITILSSNLYSRPEESFLRETICNAVDSHVEAGSTEPIVLSLLTNKAANDNIVAIRDYGTGISPERFEEIYLNIGSSTKRESNDYIGSFGIGRFSALACSNVVHITSYYNGIAYYYLMMKDGTKIKVDKISETPTKEKNGVEVKIQVEQLRPYYEALKYLYYIPNLYVHDNQEVVDSRVSSFNERRIAHYKHFSTGLISGQWDSEIYVLVGKVIYRCDPTIVIPYGQYNNEYHEILRHIQLHFDITDVDITPNRESLLYSDRTKAALKKKIDDTIAEMGDIIKSKPMDITDLSEYLYYVYKSKMLNLEDVRIPLNGSPLIKEINYTFRGVDIANNEKGMKNSLYNIFYGDIKRLPFLCIIKDGIYLKEKEKRKINLEELVINKATGKKNKVEFIRIPNYKGINGTVLKSFLSSKYANEDGTYIFVPVVPTTNFIEDFLSDDSDMYVHMTGTGLCDTVKTDIVMTYFREFVDNNGKVIDYVNSKEYLDYKADIKRDSAALCQKFDKTIRVYFTTHHKSYGDDYWVNSHYDDVSSIDQIEKSISYVIKDISKHTILYGDRDNPLFRLFSNLMPKAKRMHYIFVTVAKTNVRYLKAAPSHWKPIEEVMNEDLLEFRQLVTYKMFRVNVSDMDRQILYSILDKIPEADEHNIELALEYTNRVDRDDLESLNQLLPKFIKKGNQYDLNLKDGLITLKKYVNIVKNLYGLYNLCGNAKLLFAFLAMKHKFFRINFKSYKEVKLVLNRMNNENND